MFTVTRETEVKLVETVTGLKEETQGWTGVHFRFARLMDHYRSEYQIKIALNLANDILKTYQGGIFICADSDMFVVVRGATSATIDKVVFQLRYLFTDDPLSYTNDGEENPDFCEVYNLDTHFNDFLNFTKKKLALLSKRGKGAAAVPLPTPQKAASVEQEIPAYSSQQTTHDPVLAPLSIGAKHSHFNPAKLASVERDLVNADLSKVMRRQPICAALPATPIRKVFDEIYINISHLRQLLRSDADFLSNRWLFKYLTSILDERMLDMIKRSPARFLDNPISLNMNIDTLLSQRFIEFDAAINPSTKVSIVIEIQVADVFADMSAFLLAKDQAQKLGYRVCLDGLTNLSFTQVDRERLGFDLAKLQWNADIESDLKTKDNKRLAEAVRECGANRIILCRCDSRQAVDYGQALGISLFQGRYLDMMVNPTSKIEN